MSKMTSEQAKPQRGGNRNPNGKGGFKKGESGNPGGRPRNIQRYDYWIQFFKDMSVTEFKQYAKTRKEDDMYVAEVQAMQRVSDSMKDMKTWQIIAERTEGKAPQSIDVTTGGEPMRALVEFIDVDTNNA